MRSIIYNLEVEALPEILHKHLYQNTHSGRWHYWQQKGF